MDRNIKRALYIATAVLVGVVAYKIVPGLISSDPVRNVTVEAPQSPERTGQLANASPEALQKEQQRRKQQRAAELARQPEQREPRDLFEHILCAANDETGKCACYDRRTNRVIPVELEKCREHARR